MKTKIFKLSVIIVLLNVSAIRSFAQTDTSFWFVAPYVTYNNEWQINFPMIFHITSFGQPSTVTISMPVYSGFTPIVTNIPADQTVSVDVTKWKSLLQNSPGDSILPKGIHISSTNPVTVYYQVGQSLNPEIYVLKGSYALGTHFVIPGQNKYSNDLLNNYYNNTAKSAFDIVATEDNTTIKVKLSQDAIYVPPVTEWRKSINYTYYGNIGTCAQCDYTCMVAYGKILFNYTDTLISNIQSTYVPDTSTFKTIHRSDTIWSTKRSDYPLCYQIMGSWSTKIEAVTYKDTLIPNRPKYHAGDTITIKLNKGQTYSLIAYSQTGAGHLVGSIVTSDKPIAVSIKDDSMDVTSLCQDLVGDQIVPVDVTGTDYIAIRGDFTYSSGPEGVFVTASQDSTNVTVNGVLAATLNTGATYFDSISKTAPLVYIKTSKPAYAFQLTGVGCEAAGSLLPRLSCTGSKKVSFTRFSKEEFILKLIASKNIANNFYLSVNGGQQIHIDTSNFKPVPGTNYMAARIIYDTINIPVNSQCIIENDKGSFQMGFISRTVYDGMYGCMQGYFSDFNNGYSSTIQQKRFAGCDVALSVNPSFSKYIWTDENLNKAMNETTNSLTFQITNKVKDTIVYSIASNGACIDTVKFVVTPKSPITFKQNLCASGMDSIQLSFDTTQYYTSFKWIDSLQGDSIHTKIYTKINKKDTIFRLWFMDHSCILPADTFKINFSTCSLDQIDTLYAPLDNAQQIKDSIILSTKDSCLFDYTQPIDTFYIASAQVNGSQMQFNWVFKQGVKTYNVVSEIALNKVSNGYNLIYLTIQCNIVKKKGSLYSTTFVAPYYISLVSVGNIIQSALNVNLYPNPANDKFTMEVDNLKETYILEILNTMGQVVLNKQISNPVEQVDLSGMPVGVYFVKMQTENNIFVKKIIKQ